MNPNEATEMPFLSHFEELRHRLLIAVIGLVVATVASFTVAQYLLELLARPIGGIDKLQAIEVTESIGVYMRISLMAGVVLAMPIIVYQLLRFILPGLKPNEKRWVALAVPSATLLFASGIIFTYMVMLPPSIQFLTNFMEIQTTPRLANYINFVINLLFWVGISFETPLLIFILAKLKIVNGKMLLRQWRIAIVIVSVLAAIITPTVDPVNMGLLMIPLIALYFLSVLLAFLA